MSSINFGVMAMRHISEIAIIARRISAIVTLLSSDASMVNVPNTQFNYYEPNLKYENIFVGETAVTIFLH